MEELIAELGRQGPFAILLGIVIYFYYRKDQSLAESYKERITDNNRLATVIESTNTSSRALEVTSENRSRVIESMGEATRATAEAIKSQVTILDHVRQTVERNNVIFTAMQDDIEEMRKERREEMDNLRRDLLNRPAARR